MPYQARLAAESDAAVAVRVESELRRLGELDARQRRVRAAVATIADDALTLKCPRVGCGQVSVVRTTEWQCIAVVAGVAR